METAVQTVEPTESAVWEVNTLEDSTDWTVDDEVVSLREAIERAQTGDTITFDDGLAALIEAYVEKLRKEARKY